LVCGGKELLAGTGRKRENAILNRKFWLFLTNFQFMQISRFCWFLLNFWIDRSSGSANRSPNNSTTATNSSLFESTHEWYKSSIKHSSYVSLFPYSCVYILASIQFECCWENERQTITLNRLLNTSKALQNNWARQLYKQQKYRNNYYFFVRFSFFLLCLFSSLLSFILIRRVFCFIFAIFFRFGCCMVFDGIFEMWMIVGGWSVFFWIFNVELNFWIFVDILDLKNG
jgi:hypothetical protein